MGSEGIRGLAIKRYRDWYGRGKNVQLSGGHGPCEAFQVGSRRPVGVERGHPRDELPKAPVEHLDAGPGPERPKELEPL